MNHINVLKNIKSKKRIVIQLYLFNLIYKIGK